MLLEQNEVRRLFEKVQNQVTLPEAFTRLSGMAEALSRFGRNAMVQNVDRRKTTLTLTVTRDTRSGTASTTDFSDESLARLVQRAEKLAEWNKPDPEHQPPLGPQKYADIPAWFEETARLSPDARAQMIAVITRLCEADNAEAAGTCSSGERMLAVGNNAGLFGYHRWTTAGLSCTVRTGGGAGSSKSLVEDVRDHHVLNPEAMARRTLARAKLSENPREIEPKEYPILLEPQGVAIFTWWLLGNLDARAADEGRSPFSRHNGGGNRCGDKIAADSVTLASCRPIRRCSAARFTATVARLRRPPGWRAGCCATWPIRATGPPGRTSRRAAPRPKASS